MPITVKETFDQIEHHAGPNKSVIFTTKEDNARVSLLGLPKGGELIISTRKKKAIPISLPPGRELLVYRRDEQSPNIDDVALIITTS